MKSHTKRLVNSSMTQAIAQVSVRFSSSTWWWPLNEIKMSIADEIDDEVRETTWTHLRTSKVP